MASEDHPGLIIYNQTKYSLFAKFSLSVIVACDVAQNPHIFVTRSNPHIYANTRKLIAWEHMA